MPDRHYLPSSRKNSRCANRSVLPPGASATPHGAPSGIYGVATGHHCVPCFTTSPRVSPRYRKLALLLKQYTCQHQGITRKKLNKFITLLSSTHSVHQFLGCGPPGQDSLFCFQPGDCPIVTKEAKNQPEERPLDRPKYTRQKEGKRRFPLRDFG